VGARRRTRKALQGGSAGAAAQSVGTVHRTGSVTRARRRTRSTLVWATSIAVVVVAALAVATVLVIGRLGSGAIPVVADVRAEPSPSSVTFTWADPGLRTGDTYVISSNGAASQQTGTSFVVSGQKGDEECIAVAVNRDGKTGVASAQKCATIGSAG
jgi:hypothetical protein